MKLFFCLFSLTIAITSSCKQKQDDKNTDIKDTAVVVADKLIPAQQDTAVPQNGMYEKKHPNGQISIRGEMRDGKREGVWKSYYESGLPWSEGEYKNGVREGISITWYENGQKRYEGRYANGKQAGKWKYWNENGQLEKEIDYDKTISK